MNEQLQSEESPKALSGAEQAPVIGATGDQPAVGMTPGQAALAKQVKFDDKAPVGSSRNPRFQRPDTTDNDLAGLGPQDVTVDLQGKPRVGPYSGGVQMEDDFAKAHAEREMAADDKLEAEVHEAAAAEEAAENPTMGGLGGGVGFKTMGAIGPALGDVAKGVAQAPAAVVLGVKDAYNSTISLAEDVASSIEQFLHLDEIPFGVIGYKGLDGDKSTPFELVITSRKKALEEGLAKAKVVPQFDTEGAEKKLDGVTANFIKNASQFGAGMLTGDKVLKGWGWAAKQGSFIRPLIQGGIADFTAFDGMSGNLSSMLQELAPEFRNPITEFLTADEDDPELLNRARNALEGAGLGLAVDTLMQGLRGMKAARKAKEAARAEAEAKGFQTDPTVAPEAAEAQAVKVEAEVQKALKKPKKLKTVDPVKLAEEITTAKVEPNEFDLPLHRFNTPEDVQATIAQMARRNAKDIDAARRGVQTWADTTKGAKAIDAIESMANRQRGEAMNAETVLAYKQAMIGANETLTRLAKELLDAPNDLAKQVALRRAAAAAQAIQLEFMGARAEAGRALQAFKIAADAGPYRLLDLEAQLREAGGAKGAVELAEAIKRLVDKKGHALDAVGAAQHWGNSLKTIYTNGMMSGLGTPIANVAGSLINMAQDGLNRVVAGTLGDATEAGEALELFSGYVGSLTDAFKLRPSEALPDGIARGGREERGALTPQDPRVDRPLSAAAFRVDEMTPWGKALNVIDVGTRAPQIVNQWADDYFAAIGGRGSIRASAWRYASREGRAAGWGPEEIAARQADLIQNPTRQMLDEAEQHIKEMTFSRDDGEIEQTFQSLRRKLDNFFPGAPIGTILIPFIRTPANIISLGMRNSPLAPFSSRWRDDIAAGGVRKDRALSQLALGTALYGLWSEMVMEGTLTGGGPRNDEQRDAMMREGVDGGVNWQPYSIKVGDRWVQYSRFEPLGQVMSIIADIHEVMANSDWDEATQEEIGEVLAHIVGAVGKATFDKTMLRGTFDLVEAVRSGNTTKLERELGNRGAAFIPMSGALRMGRRLQDPYMRETTSIVETMKNALPFGSDDLAVSRDLWGKPRTYQSGLGAVYDMINLTPTRRQRANTIDLEILDQGVSVAMPQKQWTMDGVTFSLKNEPEIYSEFIRLAGEPAFAQLEAVVTGDHPDSAYYYSLSDGPNGEKAAYIKAVVAEYRKAARQEIEAAYYDRLSRLAADKTRRVEEARNLAPQ